MQAVVAIITSARNSNTNNFIIYNSKTIPLFLHPPVISISGNTYDWNEKSGKEGHDVGVIAQEVEKVLPEAVTERDNGYLAVDYHKIIPLLIESIKDLSAKVESLEQKLLDK